MSDPVDPTDNPVPPTPPPAVTPTPPDPAPKPKRSSPSSINQELAQAITDAESIAQTATKSAYAGPLREHGLPADFAAGILSRVVPLRDRQSAATLATARKESDTKLLKLAREQLLGYMQQAQSWARFQFFFTDPSH